MISYKKNRDQKVSESRSKAAFSSNLADSVARKWFGSCDVKTVRELRDENGLKIAVRRQFESCGMKTV